LTKKNFIFKCLNSNLTKNNVRNDFVFLKGFFEVQFDDREEKKVAGNLNFVVD